MYQGYFKKAIIAILIVIALGMSGLMLAEHLTPWQALFLTVETLTTVGFGDIEVHSLAGQIIVFLLMLGGVALTAFIIGRMMAFVLEGRLADIYGQRKREKKMEQLRNHVIVCGAGRVGQQVAKFLKADNLEVVIIEQDEAVAQAFIDEGYLVVRGDATQDENLKTAGIEHARGLITALPEDALNVFVTLTAKGLNPKIQVVARGDRLESEAKLYRAGADRVISPATLSGKRMALSITKPMTIEYLDTVIHDHNIHIEIKEVKVDPGTYLIGLRLDELKTKQNTGATILAILRRGQVISNPSASDQIETGDVLIVFGLRNQVQRLEEVAAMKSEI
jgi:voltage-gated potassium channel